MPLLNNEAASLKRCISNEMPSKVRRNSNREGIVQVMHKRPIASVRRQSSGPRREVLLAPSRSSLQLMKGISGLGMEDPVFGAPDNSDFSEIDTKSLGDVSVTSDPTDIVVRKTIETPHLYSDAGDLHVHRQRMFLPDYFKKKKVVKPEKIDTGAKNTPIVSQNKWKQTTNKLHESTAKFGSSVASLSLKYLADDEEKQQVLDCLSRHGKQEASSTSVTMDEGSSSSSQHLHAHPQALDGPVPSLNAPVVFDFSWEEQINLLSSKQVKGEGLERSCDSELLPNNDHPKASTKAGVVPLWGRRRQSMGDLPPSKESAGFMMRRASASHTHSTMDRGVGPEHSPWFHTLLRQVPTTTPQDCNGDITSRSRVDNIPSGGNGNVKPAVPKEDGSRRQWETFRPPFVVPIARMETRLLPTIAAIFPEDFQPTANFKAPTNRLLVDQNNESAGAGSTIGVPLATYDASEDEAQKSGHCNTANGLSVLVSI